MQARDVDGRYAAQNPELHQWFEGLRSGKGPCCSDADGSAVSDVDWDTAGGHYRVRIDGAWIDVPDEAVITEPNRIGRTMVWPIRGYLGISSPLLHAGINDMNARYRRLIRRLVRRSFSEAGRLRRRRMPGSMT